MVRFPCVLGLIGFVLGCAGLPEEPSPVEAPAPRPASAPAREGRGGTTQFEGWIEPGGWDETDVFVLTNSEAATALWCKDPSVCSALLSEHGHDPRWMFEVQARPATPKEKRSREDVSADWVVVSMGGGAGD